MVVDTVRIDTTIYLYQVPLTEAQLAMLGEIIPVNLLADNHIQYLKFDEPKYSLQFLMTKRCARFYFFFLLAFLCEVIDFALATTESTICGATPT